VILEKDCIKTRVLDEHLATVCITPASSTIAVAWGSLHVWMRSRIML
jgi:hypothetical protein